MNGLPKDFRLTIIGEVSDVGIWYAQLICTIHDQAQLDAVVRTLQAARGMLAEESNGKPKELQRSTT